MKMVITHLLCQSKSTLDNLCSYFCTILLYLLCFLIHIIERERDREGTHKLSSVYGSNLPERGMNALGIIIVPEWGHSVG